MAQNSENTSKHQLDDTDLKILEILQENSKLGNKEIAEKIGLTVTPTFERVKRLERLRIIQSYTALVDKKAIGKGLKVLCQVSLKAHNLDLLLGFEDEVVHLNEVSACFHIAGNYDYLLTIEVGDMDEYQQFLKEKLASIPNIANVQSSFVMSTLK